MGLRLQVPGALRFALLMAVRQIGKTGSAAAMTGDPDA